MPTGDLYNRKATSLQFYIRNILITQGEADINTFPTGDTRNFNRSASAGLEACEANAIKAACKVKFIV